MCVWCLEGENEVTWWGDEVDVIPPLGLPLRLEDMSNFELIILRPPDKLPGALGWRDVFFLIGNVAAPIFRVVGKVQKGWPSGERFQKMFTNGYVQKGVG